MLGEGVLGLFIEVRPGLDWNFDSRPRVLCEKMREKKTHHSRAHAGVSREWSSALDGMQPTLRHVPPRRPRDLYREKHLELKQNSPVFTRSRRAHVAAWRTLFETTWRF